MGQPTMCVVGGRDVVKPRNPDEAHVHSGHDVGDGLGKMPWQVGHVREGSGCQVGQHRNVEQGGSYNASANRWSPAQRKVLDFL
jgi:hypothetical protein